MKKNQVLSENFQFLEVKLSIYLNRRVFVMTYMCVCDFMCGVCSFIWCLGRAVFRNCGIYWVSSLHSIHSLQMSKLILCE